MICVNMKHAFAHHPFFVSSADAAHPMALALRISVLQSPSRSSTQQWGASAPASSWLSTIPVTGLGRKTVQPFKPLS